MLPFVIQVRLSFLEVCHYPRDQSELAWSSRRYMYVVNLRFSFRER